jgi:hypothetical protein
MGAMLAAAAAVVVVAAVAVVGRDATLLLVDEDVEEKHPWALDSLLMHRVIRAENRRRPERENLSGLGDTRQRKLVTEKTGTNSSASGFNIAFDLVEFGDL